MTQEEWDAATPEKRVLHQFLEAMRECLRSNGQKMRGHEFLKAMRELVNEADGVSITPAPFRFVDAPKRLQDALLHYHAKPVDVTADALIRAVFDAYGVAAQFHDGSRAGGNVSDGVVSDALPIPQRGPNPGAGALTPDPGIEEAHDYGEGARR